MYYYGIASHLSNMGYVLLRGIWHVQVGKLRPVHSGSSPILFDSNSCLFPMGSHDLLRL